MTGQVFGLLTVVGPSERRGVQTYWKCRCACGRETWGTAGKLRFGHKTSCGCRRAESNRRGGRLRVKDHSGERYGRLVVSAYVGIVRGEAGWRCLCDCGKESTVRGSALKTTKSCGCLARERATRVARMNFAGRWGQAIGEERPSAWALLKHYEDGAKARSLPFELSFDDFVELTKGDCFYCGAEPHRSYRGNRTSGRYTYNGIDRCDNALGYIKGNVVSCCFTCNSAKHTMSLAEFYAWIKRIYERKDAAVASRAG